MNVLIITLRADVGGGPEHVYQLVKNSMDSVCFHIACPDDVPYIGFYEKLVSTRIVQVPHRKFKIRSLLQLIFYIKKNNINIIHSHGKGAGLYTRMLTFVTRVPSVHTPHGIHMGEYNFFRKWLYKLYENLTSFCIKEVLFVSASEKKLASEIGLWPGVKNKVIYNGVNLIGQDEKKSWRHNFRDKLGFEENHFVVSMISRFDYPKNMKEAYRIAKQCPDISFIWIGDGDEKYFLEHNSKLESVDNIMFIGFVDNPKYYLAASDVYMSTSRWEGLPLGMLEAMSLSLPVVASKVTGHIDLVKDCETGFFYPLGDVSLAIDKLMRLKNDPVLRHRQGSEARSRQQRLFNVENMAKEIVCEYRNIM